MEKTPNMLNNKVGALVEKFAVNGKVKLVGSQQRRGHLFASDYDLLTQLNGRPETLARYFKEVMLAIPRKDFYFMDFKAGLDKRLVYDFEEDDLAGYLQNPLIAAAYKRKIKAAKGEVRVKLIRDLFILRWTPGDITRGFVKLVDGTEYSLEEALQDDTTIKLDIVIPVGDRFAEVSELYVYKQMTVDNSEVMRTLADDIDYYRHENTMKSLKRLYSVLELNDKKDPRLAKLEAFFNTEYGLLNKCANDLALLLLLTEKHAIPFAKITSNLQMIKENLASTAAASKEKVLTLDSATAKNYRKVIEKLIKYLRGVINPVAKDVLRGASVK
jgi:hypothetical protein